MCLSEADIRARLAQDPTLARLTFSTGFPTTAAKPCLRLNQLDVDHFRLDATEDPTAVLARQRVDEQLWQHCLSVERAEAFLRASYRDPAGRPYTIRFEVFDGGVGYHDPDEAAHAGTCTTVEFSVMDDGEDLLRVALIPPQG